MITASHLPAERNGFKFILPTGGLESSQLDELIEVIRMQTEPGYDDNSEPVDFLPHYLEKQTAEVTDSLGFEKPLTGLRIVIDASGGSGGFYEEWLRELGAGTTGSMNLQPDGLFSCHPPNPEDSSAMRSLVDTVARNGADLGVIFDADCDRAALVDQDGAPLNRERLIALCVDIVLSAEPGATIVTDSVTSPALTRFIESRGGFHRRWKRGYRNVIGEARRLNASGIPCPLAMETSGHAAFRSNNFLDDGMTLATRLIIETVRSKRAGTRLTDRIGDLPLPIEDVERRIPTPSGDERQESIERVFTWLKTDEARSRYYAPPDEPEGARAELIDGSGWFLLRASLHDPMLVLNAQSNRQGDVERMINDLRSILGRNDI